MKGRRKAKKTPKLDATESVELVQAPHSFVIHRGHSCPYIQDLTKDFRRLMEPFTALHLKERKSNKIKDFVNLSGIFHVSHMCIFNKASTQLSFKLIRLPRGPTLTFKVHQFTLARDVLAQSKKQFVDDDFFKHSPLVIMNNFAGEGKHLKLMSHTFQNMFPAINLATVNLSSIRRCVLFSYNPITKLVDMRHYSIVVVPQGLTKGVKKLVLGKIPNLAKCEDVADFILHEGGVSDSEVEDDEMNHVELSQPIKRKGNMERSKSSIRLHEIGPRMTFELIKIEEGLLTGEVLYHSIVVKTEEEIENIRKLRKRKLKIVAEQKKKQTEKQKEKEKKSENPYDNPPSENEADDDDAQHYKEEVGENPDDGLFSAPGEGPRKRMRLSKPMAYAKKKQNFTKDKKDTQNKKDFSKNRKDFSKNKKDFGKDKRDFTKKKSLKGGGVKKKGKKRGGK